MSSLSCFVNPRGSVEGCRYYHSLPPAILHRRRGRRVLLLLLLLPQPLRFAFLFSHSPNGVRVLEPALCCPRSVPGCRGSRLPGLPPPDLVPPPLPQNLVHLERRDRPTRTGTSSQDLFERTSLRGDEMREERDWIAGEREEGVELAEVGGGGEAVEGDLGVEGGEFFGCCLCCC